MMCGLAIHFFENLLTGYQQSKHPNPFVRSLDVCFLDCMGETINRAAIKAQQKHSIKNYRIASVVTQGFQSIKPTDGSIRCCQGRKA
jgi:hypothetical protein